MPRRQRNEILPFDEKRFRLAMHDLRRQYSHLDVYLPWLEREVDEVRELKDAGKNPRGHQNRRGATDPLIA